MHFLPQVHHWYQITLLILMSIGGVFAILKNQETFPASNKGTTLILNVFIYLILYNVGGFWTPWGVPQFIMLVYGIASVSRSLFSTATTVTINMNRVITLLVLEVIILKFGGFW